jgi:hypothetical protein
LAGMDTRAEQIYSDYLASVETKRRRLQHGWALAKQTTFLTLLVGGYLMIYLLDVFEQAFSLLGVAF